MVVFIPGQPQKERALQDGIFQVMMNGGKWQNSMGWQRMTGKDNKRMTMMTQEKQHIRHYLKVEIVVFLLCSVGAATPVAISKTLPTTATTGVVQSRVLPLRGTTTSTTASSTRASAGTTAMRVGGSRVVASRIDYSTICVV